MVDLLTMETKGLPFFLPHLGHQTAHTQIRQTTNCGH